MIASERRVSGSGGAGLSALGLVVALACGCGYDAPSTEGRRSALAAPQTVTFQDGTNDYLGTADSQIVQNAASTTYGGATSLSADGDEPSGSGKDSAILLRWDVSSIPIGSTIQSASITLRVTNASSHDYPLLALVRAWSESAATWQRAATGESWQTAGAQGAGNRNATVLGTLSARSTGTCAVTLNAAGLATLSSWVDSSARNFGLVVASASNSDGLDIASRENATVANRPRLTVVYLPPATDAGAGGTSGGDAGAGGGGASGAGGAADGGTAAAAGAAGGDGAGGGGVGGDATGGGGASGGGIAGGGGASGAAGGGIAGGGGASGAAGGGIAGGGMAGGGGAAGAAGSGMAGGGGAAGGAGPAVLYAVGDVTDCDLSADTATALLVDGTTDPIALLGDIAYPNGSPSDFANCYDPALGTPQGRASDPAPGNHEYQTAGSGGLLRLLRRGGRRSGEGVLQLRPRRLARRRAQQQLLRA